MKEFRNILLITDRNDDFFEVITTNAPDSVIKTEVDYFKSCQQFKEEDLIGKGGEYYPIIKALGYKVQLVCSDQSCALKDVSYNNIDQVFDYSNDYVEITIHEHKDDEKELKEAKLKIKDLEIANEMLRKALLQTTKNVNQTDVRVSRKDFVEIHDMAVSEMFEKIGKNDEEDDVHGFPVTVHWHGMYCDCGDGATPANHIIPGILSCDDELDGEEECV